MDKIFAMREGGKKLREIRNHLIDLLKPGLDLMEIEDMARKMIKDAGAIANFAFTSDYGFATCIMVNEEVVHCRPIHRNACEGDLVTVDIGLEWQGYHLDTADSKLVGKPDDKFISVGRQALKEAISQAWPGKRIGQISRIIEQVVKKGGYSAVQQYCGHGIGKKLHEEPQIYCFLDRPIEKTMLIKPGMTLAIEVMANEGGQNVIIGSDGWHSEAADGLRSLQLEHTVLVTGKGPEILT